jgi:hypothetical protein
MLTTLLCCSNEMEGASLVDGSICWKTSLKLKAPSVEDAAASVSVASMEMSSEYVSGSSGVAASRTTLLLLPLLPAELVSLPTRTAAAAAALLKGVHAATGPPLLVVVLLLLL